MRALPLFAALTLLAAGWCGASYAIGRKISGELEARQHSPARPTGVAIVQLDHHPGVFTSHGSAELRLSTGCGAFTTAQQLAPTFNVEYTITHTPGLGAPVRVQLRARPLRIFGYDMRALVGSEPLLTGSVVVNYTGDVVASFRANPVTRQTSAGSLNVAASRGRVEVSGDKTLRLSWVLPEFRALTPRSDVHFEGLELHWKLDDRTLGTGKTWFHVARAQLGGSRAEGVGIATHGELGAEQLKLQLTASAKKLDFNGLILERVFAQAATSGIAAAPARTLMTLARENCVEALSPADDAAWHAAQRSLSDGGGTLTVSPLTAASSDGGLNGDLSVELSPAARAPGRLLSRVRARGQLKLDGASLSSRAKTQRGLGGYFLDDPSGVHASFSFEQRRLQVNDRPWNGLMYQLALTMFERTLGL